MQDIGDLLGVIARFVLRRAGHVRLGEVQCSGGGFVFPVEAEHHLRRLTRGFLIGSQVIAPYRGRIAAEGEDELAFCQSYRFGIFIGQRLNHVEIDGAGGVVVVVERGDLRVVVRLHLVHNGIDGVMLPVLAYGHGLVMADGLRRIRDYRIADLVLDDAVVDACGQVLYDHLAAVLQGDVGIAVIRLMGEGDALAADAGDGEAVHAQRMPRCNAVVRGLRPQRHAEGERLVGIVRAVDALRKRQAGDGLFVLE